MKKYLLSYAIILTSSLAGVITFTWLEGNCYAALTLAAVALVSTGLFIYSWMKYVAKLVALSENTLTQNKAHIKVSDINNIERLEKNYRNIDSKIKQAVSRIKKLSEVSTLQEYNDQIEDNDIIGEALQEVKKEMLAFKEEDDKRKWITQGLANFSEILRDKGELKEYTRRIVSNLVKYLQANQGSLFIATKNEEDERCMELMACYAYDKQKFVEKRIMEGQGILGQCMLEHEFIYLAEIPANYIKITSGLGEATPRNLIVMPLMFNDEFYGLVEMAFFNEVLPHEIEFLKAVGENIAAEISSIKTIEQTQVLLDKSHLLTEELQTREEEMKQNLEELAATQEEMVRKQTELAGVLQAIDATLATAEFDVRGKLISYNTIFENIFKFSPKQLELKDYRLLLEEADISFNHVVNGRVKEGDFHGYDANRNPLWLRVTFTVVHNNEGQVHKILTLLQDVTEKKNQEQQFERLSLVANNTDNAVIITDNNGVTEFVNEGFIKMTGYQAAEIIGKKPGVLLQGADTDADTVHRIREQIKARKPVYEEILNYNKNGKSYWVSIAINPVFNKRGEIDKFISIQADITKTKEASLDFKYKLEAISRSNAVVEFDPFGFVLDANDNFLELTEFRLEEIRGKHQQIFVKGVSGSKDKYEDIWQKVQLGEFASDECECSTKSGKTIWLKGVYNPILDVHGKLKKVIKFSVDVTEEKRLQLVANKKQKELNSYLDGINNTIASAEFTPNGKFLSANDIFIKVMGYHKEDIAGKDYTLFLGDDPASKMMWENLRLGKFFSGEFKMKNKIGKELWLVGTFNPIMIDQAAPEKIMMFAQFTTQEKEKVNDLNSIVQTVKYALPVLELNDHFMCKTANEKFAKLFGVSRLELRSKSILDFVDPTYHNNWLKHQMEILGADFITLNVPMKLGKQAVTYEVSLSIARNLEGEISKIIMLFVREVVERVSVFAVG